MHLWSRSFSPQLGQVCIAWTDCAAGGFCSPSSISLTLKNVPPGRYRVDVWYERASPEALQALTREVTIPSEVTTAFRLVDAIQGPVQHKNKYGKDYDKAHPYGEP